MYENLLKALEAKGSGVRGYEDFAASCLERAVTERESAAFLFVLGMIAQRFAAHYYERPLSVAETVAQKDKIRGYMERMKGLGANDAGARLAVLNGMVVDELQLAE